MPWPIEIWMPWPIEIWNCLRFANPADALANWNLKFRRRRLVAVGSSSSSSSPNSENNQPLNHPKVGGVPRWTTTTLGWFKQPAVEPSQSGRSPSLDDDHFGMVQRLRRGDVFFQISNFQFQLARWMLWPIEIWMAFQNSIGQVNAPANWNLNAISNFKFQLARWMPWPIEIWMPWPIEIWMPWPIEIWTPWPIEIWNFVVVDSSPSARRRRRRRNFRKYFFFFLGSYTRRFSYLGR